MVIEDAVVVAVVVELGVLKEDADGFYAVHGVGGEADVVLSLEGEGLLVGEGPGLSVGGVVGVGLAVAGVEPEPVFSGLGF